MGRYVNKYPDGNGYFGEYGGRFVPETLMPALEELEDAFKEAREDPGFWEELDELWRKYAGRPTPLYYARNLSRKLGVKVYLKREDLVHGGAHKLNNTLGQTLLADRMGKDRIIAETGAGQHGLATAMAGAALGKKVEIYMGAVDVERQKHNVFRMELMGAEVHPVKAGTQTLKDAINEALRDWITNLETTHYLLGSVVGPHPYPWIVREFQRVIGRETREQIMELEGGLPNAIVACTGGGSNSIGIFYDFLDDEEVALYAVEAGGKGLDTDEHSASLCVGDVGVLHGCRTKVLQDEYGQIRPTHSIAPGLDYPGVGPELAFLVDEGRITADAVTDEEALRGFVMLNETEGILPALESSHAVYYVQKLVERGELDRGDVVIVNISGRGDKDVRIAAKELGVEI
ncbi:tryptophan synthase subunit beta [Methanopyrus sp.]